MDKQSKIYIAGHTGLVGTAIKKELENQGYTNLVFRTFSELDLTDQLQAEAFFRYEKPEYVFLAAAKVGGIHANNTYRADFIYENLMIQNNVIHQAYKAGVKKLLFLGSTCIYPKQAQQPIKEEYLLTDELEYTNEPYAIAKIAGIKMCESYNLQYNTNFISVMPTNLYGKGDNFNLETSHVLPALMRKIHLGKCLEQNDWQSIRKDLKSYPVGDLKNNSSEIEILEKLKKIGISSDQNKGKVEIWGSGKPLREFLWSEDMANACVYIMQNIDFGSLISKDFQLKKDIKNTHINIGSGEEISIKDLAYLIKKKLNFKGELYFNADKPDGTPRKLIDVSKLNNLGWEAKVKLERGVEELYKWYLG